MTSTNPVKIATDNGSSYRRDMYTYFSLNMTSNCSWLSNDLTLRYNINFFCLNLSN
jgi:hypothetical protein